MSVEYERITCYRCLMHKPLYNVIVDNEGEGADMGLCKQCVEKHKKEGQ